MRRLIVIGAAIAALAVPGAAFAQEPFAAAYTDSRQQINDGYVYRGLTSTPEVCAAYGPGSGYYLSNGSAHPYNCPIRSSGSSPKGELERILLEP
jgi:hypothetical protein